MMRVITYSGVLTAAAAVIAALVLPNPASTQTLPPPSSLRVIETTYASVGVSTIGATGSVAWFIETDANKERHPIACVSGSGGVECKRGNFPQP